MSHPVWSVGHYVSGLSVRPSVRPSHFTGTTLFAALGKIYDFSTNYHACMAMPTWCRCAPRILFWLWPPLNLDFVIDLHWGVPLCVQYPAKAMTFQQIIMHVWQYPHDVDVHLIFCYLPRRRRPGTGDIATPPVRLSVCLSVRPSVRHI